MDVIDLVKQRLRLRDVSVVSAAALPEPMVCDPVRLDVSHFWQEVGSMSLDPADGAPSHGNLHGSTERRRVVFAFERANQQMHMLRHDHVSPNEKTMLLLRLVDGLTKPVSGSIAIQKRSSMKARERQRVRVPGFVDSPKFLELAVHDHSRPIKLACLWGGMPSAEQAVGMPNVVLKHAYAYGKDMPPCRAERRATLQWHPL